MKKFSLIFYFYFISGFLKLIQEKEKTETNKNCVHYSTSFAHKLLKMINKVETKSQTK